MPFVTTNNLDDVAIYLGINRLPGETNSDFVKRIKRIATVRYGTDQKTLVKSITNQIGLEYKQAMLIKSNHPFTVTINNEHAILQSFPVTGGGEYIKVFINTVSKVGVNSSYPLKKIKSAIDASLTFTALVIDENLMSAKRENVLHCTNSENRQDVIAGKRTIIDAKKIIPNSLSSISPDMKNSVDSLQDLSKYGDYYFDNETNYLELFTNDPTPFIVSFKEYDPTFTMLVSDFNLLSPITYSRYGLSDNFINLLELTLSGRQIGSDELL
jgi:hypothetical protein